MRKTDENRNFRFILHHDLHFSGATEMNGTDRHRSTPKPAPTKYICESSGLGMYTGLQQCTESNGKIFAFCDEKGKREGTASCVLHCVMTSTIAGRTAHPPAQMHGSLEHLLISNCEERGGNVQTHRYPRAIEKQLISASSQVRH